MKHLPKIFLALAIIEFIIGSTELAENNFFYLGRPLGAIFFILFMIFRFTNKEVESYDQDQEARLTAIKAQAKSTKSPGPSQGSGYGRRPVVAHG
jgi:hypothetical protein